VTTVIPTNSMGRVDAFGNYVITPQEVIAALAEEKN